MRIVLILGAAAAAGLITWAVPALPVIAVAAALAAALAWALTRPDPEVPPSLPALDPAEPEEPLLETLIEAVDDPVLLIDRQRVAQANEAARSLLGSHIVGEDVRLAIRHPGAADRMAAGDTNQPIQLVGIGDVERRWDLVVRSIGGDRRLVRLADRTGAYAAERSRVDFVANASHELRTPLATLLGFIETLEDRNAAEDAATRARFLGIMMGEAKRMQRLVEDLLSLSRIEADKYSQPNEMVDLAAVVDDARRAFQADPANAGRVEVSVSEDAGPVIGDRAQLSQLVHNLVGNALKYGRAGAPVRISLAPVRGAMMRLTVRDQGDGIPPEHVPRLTERFYRADPGRSRSLGGTGLGLAIVKHIVERHRGRLEIASEIGIGTVVQVQLPAAATPAIRTAGTPTALSL